MEERKIAGKTKHGEIDIDSLAAIQPCMSRVLPENPPDWLDLTP